MPSYRTVDEAFLSYCADHNIDPSEHPTARTYWVLETTSGSKTDADPADETLEDGLPEGSRTTVLVNRYERSREARRLCIKAWGTECSVCTMSFGDRYGEVGKGFIHVHHLTPVAQIGASYRVDPVRDLRPICPNCHAIAHRKTPPFTIVELKGLIADAARAR